MVKNSVAGPCSGDGPVVTSMTTSTPASAAGLRQALGRVLDEPRFRTAARRMAATLAAERDEDLVVDELERAALGHPAVSH